MDEFVEAMRRQDMAREVLEHLDADCRHQARDVLNELLRELGITEQVRG